MKDGLIEDLARRAVEAIREADRLSAEKDGSIEMAQMAARAWAVAEEAQDAYWDVADALYLDLPGLVPSYWDFVDCD